MGKLIQTGGKALLMLALLAAALRMGYETGKRETGTVRETVAVRTDTVRIIDTLLIDRPVVRYSRTTDTVRVHFTTIERDTVLVDVPMERKVYAEDSLYRAVVSGWRVSLDSLTIYPKETTITIDRTISVKPRKWSFGVTAGPSVLATPSGSVHAGLGATVGITYRF